MSDAERLNRFCEPCRKFLDDGPDPCLGLIPGVSHACCGHGTTRSAYVVFGGHPNANCEENDTVTLRGTDAIDFFAAVNERGELKPKYSRTSYAPGRTVHVGTPVEVDVEEWQRPIGKP